MTPAVNLAKKLKINFQLHEYQHDAHSESYGLEAAEKLQVEPKRVFKTLVVQDDNDKLAVAILPVEHLLNLKKIAKAIGSKKAQMADPKLVERTTGYVLGGVSPLGQKNVCPRSSISRHNTLQPFIVVAVDAAWRLSCRRRI